jgi:predicted RNA-binding Zn-ribbon protein involved in translation (DUF1610 family)
MIEYKNNNGHKLWRLLKILFITSFVALMVVLWKYASIPVAIIGSIVLTGVYLIAVFLTSSYTSFMKDCPDCGHVVRHEPRSLYRYKKSVVAPRSLSPLDFANAIVATAEKPSPHGWTREPCLEYDSWVCDKCGYTHSWELRRSGPDFIKGSPVV